MLNPKLIIASAVRTHDIRVRSADSAVLVMLSWVCEGASGAACDAVGIGILLSSRTGCRGLDGVQAMVPLARAATMDADQDRRQRGQPQRDARACAEERPQADARVAVKW